MRVASLENHESRTIVVYTSSRSVGKMYRTQRAHERDERGHGDAIKRYKVPDAQPRVRTRAQRVLIRGRIKT